MSKRVTKVTRFLYLLLLLLKLPAKETATAKFLYIGPDNVENFTLQFNGLALE